VAQGDETDPPGDHDEQADGGDAVIALWREPVFNLKLRQVPAFLLPRLTEMAAEVADARLARHIYYERIHCLLAVAGQASRPDPTTFRLAEPPSDAERRLGAIIGQAFHQGCSLADVALATRLPASLVVAIGKRTIRRTKWLSRISPLRPDLPT
jgi:hypothetical protein